MAGLLSMFVIPKNLHKQNLGKMKAKFCFIPVFFIRERGRSGHIHPLVFRHTPVSELKGSTGQCW